MLTMSDNSIENQNNDMALLFKALKEGKRIEIARHAGAASASFAVAGDNARRASDANSRGDRVVRVLDKQGEREFECGANSHEVAELLKHGAVEL
jgi:hypothetical protein